MTIVNQLIKSGLNAALLAVTALSIPVEAQTQDIAIRFAGRVNGQPFECGKSYPDIGTTRSVITPSDFRMYVSGVHLINRQGEAVKVELEQDKVWQLEDIALLDFENAQGPCRNGTPALNQTIRGRVPVGQYTGLRFTLGVPFARNHGDPTVAPAPLSSTAMFWNWQGGYKFLKFDTATSGQKATSSPAASQGGGNASGFSVHLGSTGCASASKTTPPSACQNPNLVVINLPSFDVTRNIVVADIAPVLAKSNVDINTTGTSPGCMSFLGDADCVAILPALGLPYMEHKAGQQQLFRVE
jgi:uncharacterized repeat protein (TIGR04052 family)